jgi:hypothetical protein
VYGDPALIQLAAEDSRLPKLASSGSGHESTRVVSAICGLLGLVTIALSQWEKDRLPQSHGLT